MKKLPIGPFSQIHSHIYFDPVYIRVYYISLENQKKEVFGNTSYMKIGTEIVE